MLSDPVVVIAGIGAVGAACQWLAWKVRLPSIFFLLCSGIILGPILGWLHPGRLMGELLLPFISISVAIILFEGGLSLNLKEIKGYGSVVRNLITIGVAITWILITVIVHYIFSLNWQIAFLFGAITVVTGPTVIKPLLRVVRLKQEVANVLRWEGILIDPVGAFLALLVFEFILISETDQALGQIIWILSKLVIAGTLIGVVSGYLFGIILRRHWIPEYLRNITTLTTVVFIYMLSELIQHESGLLATTIMGIWLANTKNVWIDEIIYFKESLSILLISSLFIILAARLDISMISNLGWGVLIFLAAAQFIVRPLSVWFCTIGSRLSWKERVLISWISPRGIIAAAISSLFVIRLQEKGIPQAEVIVPLTFILIIGTVIFQSLTTKKMADLLRVSDPAPNGLLLVGANDVSLAINTELHNLEIRTILADNSWSEISRARMLGLPTYYGNPTSGHADENLDLSGIGKLIALSENKDMNALAHMHFRSEFGLDCIYSLQTKSRNEQSDKHEPVSRYQPNILFDTEVTFKILKSRIDKGEKVGSTTLTDQFDYDAYLHKYLSESILLFAVSPDKIIYVFTEIMNFSPKESWTIVRLGPPTNDNNVSG